MRIVIAGGTGFLGTPLAEACAEDGHDVRVLTRALLPGDSRHDPGTGVPGVTRVGWRPDGQSGPWTAVIDGADAVVNLAGAGIGDERWSPQRKALIRDSRLRSTRSLVAAIAEAPLRPPVFISASGVGYYGASGSDTKTEAAPAGGDFLAQLCTDWETEARRAESAATRVVLLRSGIVLERSGGVLPRMMTPFRFFAGGPMGSGRQYMSWIHRIDWVEMVRWVVESPQVTGPVNATVTRAGDEPRVRESAGPGPAPAGLHARSGVCVTPCTGRDGRRSCSDRDSVSFPSARSHADFTSGIPRSISRSEGFSVNREQKLKVKS